MLDVSEHELWVTFLTRNISFLTKTVNPALIDAGFIVCNQFHFLLTVQAFYGNFPLQGIGMGAAFLRVHQFQRASAPGVLSTLARLVHLKAMDYIHRNTGVQSSVAAPENI